MRRSDLARRNGAQNDATLCGVYSAMEGVRETQVAALRSPRSALSDGEVEIVVQKVGWDDRMSCGAWLQWHRRFKL